MLFLRTTIFGDFAAGRFRSVIPSVSRMAIFAPSIWLGVFRGFPLSQSCAFSVRRMPRRFQWFFARQDSSCRHARFCRRQKSVFFMSFSAFFDFH